VLIVKLEIVTKINIFTINKDLNVFLPLHLNVLYKLNGVFDAFHSMYDIDAK